MKLSDKVYAKVVSLSNEVARLEQVRLMLIETALDTLMDNGELEEGEYTYDLTKNEFIKKEL